MAKIFLIFILAAGAACTQTPDFPSQINLTSDFLDAGNYRQAEVALRNAEKLASHPIERAEVLNARGSLSLAHGQYTTAARQYSDALMILEGQTVGADLPVVLHNLAAAEIWLGEYDSAFQHMQHALALWQKQLPPDHSNLIRGWASMGSAEFLMGRLQDARVSIERAIGSAEKTWGPNDPVLGEMLESYAVVLDRLKLKKEAKVARARSRRIAPRPGRDARELTVNAHQALVTGPDIQLKSF